MVEIASCSHGHDKSIATFITKKYNREELHIFCVHMSHRLTKTNYHTKRSFMANPHGREEPEQRRFFVADPTCPQSALEAPSRACSHGHGHDHGHGHNRVTSTFVPLKLFSSQMARTVLHVF
jgi:hypothetical protein